MRVPCTHDAAHASSSRRVETPHRRNLYHKSRLPTPRHRWSTALWTRVLLGLAGMHTGTLESSGCLDVRFRRRWGGRACPPAVCRPAVCALRASSIFLHSFSSRWVVSCRLPRRWLRHTLAKKGGPVAVVARGEKGEGGWSGCFWGGARLFLKTQSWRPPPPYYTAPADMVRDTRGGVREIV